jgi:hypothetical protein
LIDRIAGWPPATALQEIGDLARTIDDGIGGRGLIGIASASRGMPREGLGEGGFDFRRWLRSGALPVAVAAATLTRPAHDHDDAGLAQAVDLADHGISGNAELGGDLAGGMGWIQFLQYCYFFWDPLL